MRGPINLIFIKGFYKIYNIIHVEYYRPISYAMNGTQLIHKMQRMLHLMNQFEKLKMKLKKAI